MLVAFFFLQVLVRKNKNANAAKRLEAKWLRKHVVVAAAANIFLLLFSPLRASNCPGLLGLSQHLRGFKPHLDTGGPDHSE